MSASSLLAGCPLRAVDLAQKQHLVGGLDTDVSSLYAQISLGEGLIAAGAQLVELDLSDNAFGPDGVRGFEALLKSSACFTLHELKLNNCGMGIGGGKVGRRPPSCPHCLSPFLPAQSPAIMHLPLKYVLSATHHLGSLACFSSKEKNLTGGSLWPVVRGDGVLEGGVAKQLSLFMCCLGNTGSIAYVL